jgi:Tol biopolymer transport system component
MFRSVLCRFRVVLAPLVALTSVTIAVAAANPNGSRIAFEGDRSGTWGLSVMQPDGSSITDLPAPPGAADVSYSPDGKRVAFEGDPNGDGNLEVFVMNTDGTNLIQLTDSPAWDYWPDWFPNGKQIAFTSFRDGSPRIYVMNADGSDQHVVTDPDDFEFGSVQPNVSSNGKQIVFLRNRQFEDPTIWTIDVDGRNLTELTPPGPHADLDPQFSPNGKQIVFASNRGGTFEIYVMNADGSDVAQLTTSAGGDFNPTFSPDGRQIAWGKQRFGSGDIWIMNRDGSGQVNVTNSPQFEGFPDWHQGHLVQK